MGFPTEIVNVGRNTFKSLTECDFYNSIPTQTTSQFIRGSKIISDTQFFKKLFQYTLSQETILSVRNCIITKPTAVSLNTQSFVSLSVVKLNLEIGSQASTGLQEIIEHIVHSTFLIAIISSLLFRSLYSSKSPSQHILLSGRREKKKEKQRGQKSYLRNPMHLHIIDHIYSEGSLGSIALLFAEPNNVRIPTDGKKRLMISVRQLVVS